MSKLSPFNSGRRLQPDVATGGRFGAERRCGCGIYVSGTDEIFVHALRHSEINICDLSSRAHRHNRRERHGDHKSGTANTALVVCMRVPSWSRPATRSVEVSADTTVTGFHGRIGASAPLGPGSVIYRTLREPGQHQSQCQNACRHAGAAARDWRTVPVHASGGKSRAQNLGRPKCAVGVEQIGIRQALRARDVAAAHAGARLWRSAGKPTHGARIQHEL